MLASMTGFGRASQDGQIGRLIVEVQSVNRKYFELQVSLPKEFSRFEMDVRKAISEHLSRGFVTLRVQWIPAPSLFTSLTPDPQALHSFKRAWDKIAQECGCALSDVTLPFLLERMPPLAVDDLIGEKEGACLQTCVAQALQDLIRMRQKEGASLRSDLTSRLEAMRHMLQTIANALPVETSCLRERLQSKILETTPLAPEIEEKLIRELIVFAEKMDVTEEITRLHSHFAQFQECLSAKQKAIGRKLDFLIQEMGREINTIGSKMTSYSMVDMKNELEKLREQIQNIE